MPDADADEHRVFRVGIYVVIFAFAFVFNSEYFDLTVFKSI